MLLIDIVNLFSQASSRGLALPFPTCGHRKGARAELCVWRWAAISSLPLIIAGLVPAICFVAAKKDARDEPGHDENKKCCRRSGVPQPPIFARSNGVV